MKDRNVNARLHPLREPRGLAGVAGVAFFSSAIGFLALAPEQIDAEPGVVQPQAALTADEGEVVAQFEQEIGEVLDQCFFRLRFGVFILELGRRFKCPERDPPRPSPGLTNWSVKIIGSGDRAHPGSDRAPTAQRQPGEKGLNHAVVGRQE